MVQEIVATTTPKTPRPDDLNPATDEEAIKAYILSQAQLAGASPTIALYVASGESRFGKDKEGDLDIICLAPESPFFGKIVYARGPWQITRCYHPEISDGEAFSLEWSTKWTMERLKDKKVCMKEWTVCREYYGSK